MSIENDAYADSYEESHEPYDIHPLLSGSHTNPDDTYDLEIRHRMLIPPNNYDVHSVTFGKFMRRFDDTPPDLFALTANSAVPLADSIRGWYEVMGTPCPEITYVDASRKLSQPEELLIIDERLSPETILRRLAVDHARLHEKHAGKSAAVVDQYVYSGKTLQLAKQTLDTAGLSVVGDTDGAVWYEGTHDPVDLDRMTSKHAAFMRSIGREAVHTSTQDFEDNYFGRHN